MDNTVIRQLEPTVMLVGAGDRFARAFQQTNIRVVRVGHAAAACERLPIAMPHVILVVGPIYVKERDALLDRATAVGAIVIDVAADLDAIALDDVANRAIATAYERRIQRDETDEHRPEAISYEEIEAEWVDSGE